MKWAESYRDPHIKEIQDWNKHYRVEESVRTYGGRAHTADGSSHEAVETIAPRNIEIMTQGGALQFEVSPVDSEGDEELVKAPNALIRSDLKMAKTRLKLIEAARERAKMGTIVVATPWERTTRIRNEAKYSEPHLIGADEGGRPVYQQDFQGWQKVEELVYEGVNWELVDLMECWLDPFTADVDKAQGIVRKRRVAFENLRKEEIREETVQKEVPNAGMVLIKTQVGHYFKDALDEIEKRLNTQTVTQDSGNDKAKIEKPQTLDTPRREIDIWTYHGWFDYDGDGLAEDCIITEATDAKIVIQLEPTGYPRRPFIVCRYVSIAGQTYGLGILKITSKMQQTINDFQNQIVDDATKNLLPMWRRTPGSQVHDEDLKYGQDKVFDAEEGEVEVFEHEMQLKHGFDVVMYAQENIRSVTGATRTLQGMPMKYSTTATEVSSNKMEANARILLNTVCMEEELIVPLLERIIEYNRAFLPDGGKILRLTNDEKTAFGFMDIKPADLAGQWDFTILGASKFQRQAELRQALVELVQSLAMIMQVFATNPQMFAQINFDLGIFIKEIAQTYNIPNIDKIFPPAPPMALPGGAPGMMPMAGGGTNDGTNGAPMDMNALVEAMQGMGGTG
jgi:hypothetical protein